MTTNVTDLVSRQMASDSRWSVDMPEFVIYVDDTGFDKIFSAHDYAFMFAGDSGLIQTWKDWIAQLPDGNPAPPITTDIALCAVHIPTSTIRLDAHQEIKLPDEATFAGSGARHAHGCWATNRDAQRAIDTAKSLDIFSGGEIKYIKFGCRSHNLSNSARVTDLVDRFLSEGFMYNTRTGAAAVPLKQAAANDEEVRKVVDGLKNGTVTARAPFKKSGAAWSASDMTALESIIADIKRKD